MNKNSPSYRQRGLAKILRWQSQVTQKIFLPFARVPHPDRWIFIIGCYNSGTSLLSKILAQHPLIGGLPDEGIYFTDRLPYPEQFGWPRMWVRCLNKMQMDPAQTSPETVNRIKRQWSLAFPTNRPNLIEKSVANSARMPFLQAHFQPAYFIYIIRNGYAVAEGIRRRVIPSHWGNPEFDTEYPISLCAEQWRASDELVSHDQRGIDKFVQVPYEDLTADPQRITREITDFLGLSPIDIDLISRRWFVRDKNESIKNMNSRSFRRLTERDIDEIERVAEPTLAKYGYDRPALTSQ